MMQEYSSLKRERSSLQVLLHEHKTKAFLSEGVYFFSSGSITGDKDIGTRGSSFLVLSLLIEGISIYNVKNVKRINKSKNNINKIILRITVLPPDLTRLYPKPKESKLILQGT